MAIHGNEGNITVKAVAMLILVGLLLPMFSMTSLGSAIGAPTAPLGPAAVPGNGKVILNWTAPVYSNASAVTEYRVYRGYDPADMQLVVTLGNVLTYEDIGLVNGITYFYGVRAVNSAGEGDMSNYTNATPCSVPNRPQFPFVTAGNLFLNITWVAPDFDGGSPIIGYNIYRQISGGWVKVGNATNQTWFIDPLLAIGTVYSYRITAYNVAGEGLASDPATGTPDRSPGAVTGLQAFSGVRNVTLTWNTPEANGGSAIIGYKIFRADNSSVFSLVYTIEPANRFIDLGLDDNQTYYYYICAFNKVGDGPYSYVVFTTTYGEPHLTLNAAIPGDQTVILHWYPVDDGGSDIKRYWVFRGLSNDTMTLYATLNDALTWTDDDVINGVTYFYSIAAENAVGVGRSQIINCTPMTVPEPPTALDGHSENHYVVLNWTAPVDDGGADILAYNIYKGLTISALKFIGTTNLTTYVVAGLEISVEYYYAVTAVNAAGEGLMSDPLKISSGRTPTLPLNLTFSEGDAFVDLAWEAPADAGTTTVDLYSIYRCNGTSGAYTKIADTTRLTYNDTTVENKRYYTYYVKAHNTIGYSDQSNRIYGHPHLSGTHPGIPKNVTAFGGDTYILVKWEAPNTDGGQPITGYNVYRGFTNDTLLYFKTVTGTEFNNTNLPLNETYYYKVQAVNAIDPGDFTDVVNATTKPLPEPKKEEKFLWGIFESMFFYVGLVMLGCVIGLFIYMKKFRNRGFKKKVAQNKTAKSGQSPANGLRKK